VKRIILYVVLSMILAGIGWFGLKASREAVAYEQVTAILVKQMDPKALAAYKAKEWAEKLSFGLYTNTKRKALSAEREKQKKHREAGVRYTYYAMGLLLIVLLAYFMLSLREFTFFGALAAGEMLYFGLTAPILMVTIHKEVEYLGDVVLSFESKSVIGSIVKLFENGDTIVALTILLFSVLIPAVKTLAMLFVSLFMQNRFAHGVVKFFKMIGKWSMVDVFVVATFLVYLTVNKGNVSRAEVEVGLYFFLAYVIISMLVSLSADKMLHRHKNMQ